MRKRDKVGKTIASVYCIVMSTILLIIVVSVLGIRGLAGALAWCFSLLILSPIGVVFSLICLVTLIIAFLKKNNIQLKILSLVVSVCAAAPIFILFGLTDIPYPIHEETQTGIYINIPFKNKEKVILIGGKEHKPHAIWPSERYAYDIVKDPFDMGVGDLEDFGIYGEEVIAPVEGTIIDVYDKDEDIKITTNEDDYKGRKSNHVYMRIDETGTYLMFEHLKQGSVNVSVGDHVQVGDVIGKTGNSGVTSEPHLHLQHQRENPLEVIHITCAEGLPIYFIDESKYTYLY